VIARCEVQSSRIFVALWPTCVVLSRYVSSQVSAGPAWSSLAQDLHISGDMKAAFAAKQHAVFMPFLEMLVQPAEPQFFLKIFSSAG